MIFLVSYYWNVREENINQSSIMPNVYVEGTYKDFINEINIQFKIPVYHKIILVSRIEIIILCMFSSKSLENAKLHSKYYHHGDS